MTTTHETTTIALVTGANRGLGLATARLLAEGGATVLVAARSTAKAELAAAQLRDEGLACWPLTLDVDSESSVVAAAEQVERDHGRLDILVNNAGILPEATTPDADRPLDLGLFRRTFDTNVFGAAAVSQAFLPLLRASDAGRIVNVSSRMGSLTDQLDPTSPYASMVLPAYQSSKAALNGLTVALAKSLSDTRVRVNSVCPGWVQTDLGGPDNRAAAPTPAMEAARTVVQMALVPADGPTGTFVDLDGPIPW
ncbi:short-chain dehydrogenase [Aeromicrobium sp. Root236]|uniref:SDR family oxidoreductase n=1 Tax=Aeromicrobium sp. Root236 TaxID=1736498 RepID=UPI0006FB3C35|nr:SDR family oxidoreductase [Aeromicrobium sp. Root236]KRC66571.1 short-chain dehydrogenase [Aeromicrobium sp. Root236]